MAFINEDIPLKDLQTFDFSVFRDERGEAFNLKRKFIPTWTIDRQRNAFLLWTGCREGLQASGPWRDFYAFWWKGDIARFSGEREVLNRACGPLITWRRLQWGFSTRLASRKEDVMALVKEALDVSELGTEGLLYPYSLQLAQS